MTSSITTGDINYDGSNTQTLSNVSLLHSPLVRILLLKKRAQLFPII